MADDSSVELVITVPEPYGSAFAHETRTRTTAGVLIQLIAGARERLVMGAPFLQGGQGLDDPRLADGVRAALSRGVDVEVVSTEQGLQELDVEGLRHGARGRLRLYRPHTNMAPNRRLGSHAKFCVADDVGAYLGSANLTGPALDGQFEMGVLVHGRVARQVADLWAYCVRLGVFVPV